MVTNPHITNPIINRLIVENKFGYCIINKPLIPLSYKDLRKQLHPSQFGHYRVMRDEVDDVGTMLLIVYP